MSTKGSVPRPQIALDKNRNKKPSHYIAPASPQAHSCLVILLILTTACEVDVITRMLQMPRLKPRVTKGSVVVSDAELSRRGWIPGPALCPLCTLACHGLRTAPMKQVFWSHCQVAELQLELVRPGSRSLAAGRPAFKPVPCGSKANCSFYVAIPPSSSKA